MKVQGAARCVIMPRQQGGDGLGLARWPAYGAATRSEHDRKQMTRRARPLRTFNGAVPVLMALALVLQMLAASVVMGDAGRGLIAMCIGGRIVHVEAGDAPGDLPGAPADHCSLCGIVLALVELDTPLGSPPGRAVAQVHPVPEAPALPTPRMPANPARAPPLPV